MPAMDVKILKFSQTGTFDTRGQAVQLLEVTFTVGTHGPFTERFPKENISSAAIMEKLNAFARELSMTSLAE